MDAPTGVGVVLAHELLDNLPFRRFRGTDQGLREVRVSIEAGELVETLAVPDPPPWAEGEVLPGRERIVPTGARDLIVQTLLRGGGSPRYLLAIDYGSETLEAGEVHGYRRHRVVEDVLADPGRTDITAGVPFADLRGHAAAQSLQAFRTVSQRAALAALGFEPWESATLERQADLLNTGRGAKAVRTWGGRSRAAMLVDPAGLGRFRWFLASTPGLPQPPWLRRALREEPDEPELPE